MSDPFVHLEIIDAIRDRMRAAVRAWCECRCNLASADRYWALRHELAGFTKNDETIVYDSQQHKTVVESLHREIKEAEEKVNRLEQALTVALADALGK